MLEGEDAVVSVEIEKAADNYDDADNDNNGDDYDNDD